MKKILLFLFLILLGYTTFSQEKKQTKRKFKPYLNIWASAQLDIIYDLKQMDPDWIGGFRPSKIPIYTTDPGWGTNGNIYFSVRASTFKFEGVLPTKHKWGDFKMRFEFDLFAMGPNAGQQQIRLRLAYGEWGPLLVGRDWSTFIDLSMFPDNFEWWGPSGMALAPANMFRFIHDFNKKNSIELALELPTGDIDPGFIRYIDPDVLQVKPKEYIPAFITRYTLDGDWGHLKVASLLNMLSYESISQNIDSITSHNKFAWAFNITSLIKIGGANKKWHGNFKLQTVFGQGYAGYSNDGGVALAYGKGKKMEVPFQYGFTAFYDHYIKDKWILSTGYSQNTQVNSEGQLGNAFNYDNYTVTQITYNIFPDRLQMGINYQYGLKRLKNGLHANDMRILFTTRFIFNYLPKELKKRNKKI
jgi:hypothetical protein